MQIVWIDPGTGKMCAFKASVVYVFQHSREIDIAVLWACPNQGTLDISCYQNTSTSCFVREQSRADHARGSNQHPVTHYIVPNF
jgi:hypothetical protein